MLTRITNNYVQFVVALGKPFHQARWSWCQEFPRSHFSPLWLRRRVLSYSPYVNPIIMLTGMLTGWGHPSDWLVWPMEFIGLWSKDKLISFPNSLQTILESVHRCCTYHFMVQLSDWSNSFFYTIEINRTRPIVVRLFVHLVKGAFSCVYEAFTATCRVPLPDLRNWTCLLKGSVSTRIVNTILGCR